MHDLIEKYSKPIAISKLTINSPPIKFLEFNDLEPQSFDEYIGQESAKEVAQIISMAAEKEDRFMPSLLITGTAGLGKTTLAKLLLKDIACMFVDGNAVNSLYPQLRDYVIVDEIHNVKPDVCDSLNILLDQEKAIIFGCTTNPGSLPKALRSRFRTINLVPYTISNLVDIMKGVLNRRASFNISDSFLEEIAKRSRSTPRRCLQYLSFVWDLMVIRNETTLTEHTLKDVFEKLGVDENGLLEIDYRYLSAFPDNGRPVGIQYLSAVLATDVETIQEEIEPYLMELKLIDRTPKGRKRI